MTRISAERMREIAAELNSTFAHWLQWQIGGPVGTDAIRHGIFALRQAADDLDTMPATATAPGADADLRSQLAQANAFIATLTSDANAEEKRADEAERELTEARRMLAALDDMCSALWRDSMGGLHDGDHGKVFLEACKRHAAVDPQFKKDFEFHGSSHLSCHPGDTKT